MCKRLTMKLVKALIVMGSLSSLFAQEKLNEQKFTVGLNFSPSLCYRYTSSDSDLKWLKEVCDSIEKPKLGFSVGVNIGYQFGNKIRFSTGVTYLDLGESIDSNIVKYVDKYVNHYQYIGIPLKMTYFFRTNKVKPYFSGGISENFLINQQTTYQSAYFKGKRTFTSNNELSNTNLMGSLSLGIETKLSNNWIFNVDLNYNQSLISIKKSPLKRSLFNTGLGIGLIRKF